MNKPRMKRPVGAGTPAGRRHNTTANESSKRELLEVLAQVRHLVSGSESLRLLALLATAPLTTDQLEAAGVIDPTQKVRALRERGYDIDSAIERNRGPDGHWRARYSLRLPTPSQAPQEPQATPPGAEVWL